MPTRQQISLQLRQELADRGMTPADPMYAFTLQSMEDLNLMFRETLDSLCCAAVMFCAAPVESENVEK